MAGNNLWEITLHGKHCLSPPACQSRIGRAPFSHVFHVPPVIGAGLSNLLSIYPSRGTSSRQPGIEAAAKGRIAPSGNAENADLVLVRAAAAAGSFGFKSQSVDRGPMDPRSDFLYSIRSDEGLGRGGGLGRYFKSTLICIADQSLYHIPPIHIN